VQKPEGSKYCVAEGLQYSKYGCTLGRLVFGALRLLHFLPEGSKYCVAEGLQYLENGGMISFPAEILFACAGRFCRHLSGSVQIQGYLKTRCPLNKL
jgi:hypothetical protein